MAFPVINSTDLFSPGGSIGVYGQFFQDPNLTDVLIDGVSVNSGDWFTNDDTNLVIDPAPSYPAGPHTLRVENADGWWEQPITYSSHPAQFNQVVPNTGDTGDTVSMYFYGFTGSTGVKFDTTNATSFTVIDDEVVEAVVPAHAAGTINVTVEAPGGDVIFNNAFTHAGTGGGGGDPHFVGFDGVPFDYQGSECEQAVWYNLYQDPTTTIHASFRKPEDVYMSFINEIKIDYIQSGEKKTAHADIESSSGFSVLKTEQEIVLRESLPSAIAATWKEEVDSELLTVSTDSIRVNISRGLHETKYKYLNFNLKLLHCHPGTTGILGQTLHKDRKPLEDFVVKS